MKTDLISRSAALNSIEDWMDDCTGDEFDRGYDFAMRRAMRIIRNAPAVDAVPVVHAEWISEVVTKCDWKGRKNQYYQPCSCSACHEPAFREYKFCPFCGARMDAESEEDTDGSQTY